MSDLISRQAAIDAVADLYWMDERLLNFKKEIDATFDKIKALPPAQQWIPLSSNQLPKEHQQVFIQFKEGRQCPHFKVQVGYLGEHEVEDVYFEKIGVKKVWYTDQYYYDLDRVVAWMPRPELYKEKEDETD